MIMVTPVTLEGRGIRLEPLAHDQREGLSSAADDGSLWELWFTNVPEPSDVDAYITAQLKSQEEGHLVPWVVRDLVTNAIVGATSYHDIVPAIDRVEIGGTWYAQRHQRTNINTTCKLLLLTHAFETLGCQVVGFRTDNFN